MKPRAAVAGAFATLHPSIARPRTAATLVLRNPIGLGIGTTSSATGRWEWWCANQGLIEGEASAGITGMREPGPPRRVHGPARQVDTYFLLDLRSLRCYTTRPSRRVHATMRDQLGGKTFLAGAVDGVVSDAWNRQSPRPERGVKMAAPTRRRRRSRRAGWAASWPSGSGGAPGPQGGRRARHGGPERDSMRALRPDSFGR